MQQTGMSYKEICETPAGVIEDLTIYFSTYAEEEHRANELASKHK